MKKYLGIISISFLISSCGNPINIPKQDSGQIYTESNSLKSVKYFKDTANNRFWLLEMEARKWDMSAKFVKAVAREVERDGRGYWGYYFQSPFKRKALFLIPDGGSFEVNEIFSGNEIRESDWKINSDRALTIAEENGVRRFPVQEMIIENRFNSPEWLISTSQGIFRVNATNGIFGKFEQKNKNE